MQSQKSLPQNFHSIFWAFSCIFQSLLSQSLWLGYHCYNIFLLQNKSILIRWCQFWSKVTTWEVEQRPILITYSYGQHMCQWVNLFTGIHLGGGVTVRVTLVTILLTSSHLRQSISPTCNTNISFSDVNIWTQTFVVLIHVPHKKKFAERSLMHGHLLQTSSKNLPHKFFPVLSTGHLE